MPKTFTDVKEPEAEPGNSVESRYNKPKSAATATQCAFRSGAG